MKAVTLLKYDETSPVLEVKEKEVPSPKAGEVRVKIHASPINPSDLMFLRGLYGFKKKTPVTAGFEGSGTITALGEGVTDLKLGDYVSCVAGQSDGTWAEEMITSVENCIPLLPGVSLDAGACFFVNPMTAWAMVEQAIRDKHPAMVQTAAASALGKMVIRLCKERSLPLINVVRRKEQEESLMALGAENILNSSSPNFAKDLYRISKKLNATYAIDAVAGETAEQLVNCLPYGSRIVCYGALSEKPFLVNSGIMLFQNKKIEGFWLSSWIYTIGLEEFRKQTNSAQKYIGSIFSTNIAKRFAFSDFQTGMEYYKNNMSEGKVVFTP